MGTQPFFEADVPGRLNDKSTPCTIEVLDQHSIPEVRIGPPGAPHNGWTASFEDWAQFEEFVDSVNQLHERLASIPRSK